MPAARHLPAAGPLRPPRVERQETNRWTRQVSERSGERACQVTQLGFGGASIGELTHVIDEARRRRCGARRMGRRHPLLRHRTLVRPRPVRAAHRVRTARPTAGRVRALDEDRPWLRAPQPGRAFDRAPWVGGWTCRSCSTTRTTGSCGPTSRASCGSGSPGTTSRSSTTSTTCTTAGAASSTGTSASSRPRAGGRSRSSGRAASSGASVPASTTEGSSRASSTSWTSTTSSSRCRTPSSTRRCSTTSSRRPSPEAARSSSGRPSSPGSSRPGRGPMPGTTTRRRRRTSRRRVGRIQAVCERHGVPLAAAALQFPLGHPAVASVIPGAFQPGAARAERRDVLPPDPGRPVGRAQARGPAARRRAGARVSRALSAADLVGTWRLRHLDLRRARTASRRRWASTPRASSCTRPTGR